MHPGKNPRLPPAQPLSPPQKRENQPDSEHQMPPQRNHQRTLAIGDIHGCSAALRTLLDAIRPTQHDLIVTLGDVIDRGPDSRGVVETLIELSGQCQLYPLLGNHEEMMLQTLLHGEPPEAWLRYGGTATLDSYGFCGDLQVIPASHIEFISSFNDVYESPTHFCLHANYDANLPLDQQPARLLRWTSLDQQLPEPHTSGKTAIVGHTANRSGEIFALPHLHCLDTHCYGDGWLTAMELATGNLWQANQQGQLRQS